MPHGNAFEERAEVRQPQARGDVVNARVARGRFEQHDVAKLAERRAGASGPRDAMKPLGGAVHRKPVTDRAEPEIQRRDIGHSRHEQKQRPEKDKRQQKEDAVDDHPPPVTVEIVLERAADEREDLVERHVLWMRGNHFGVVPQVPQQTLFDDTLRDPAEQATFEPPETAARFGPAVPVPLLCGVHDPIESVPQPADEAGRGPAVLSAVISADGSQ